MKELDLDLNKFTNEFDIKSAKNDANFDKGKVDYSNITLTYTFNRFES